MHVSQGIAGSDWSRLLARRWDRSVALLIARKASAGRQPRRVLQLSAENGSQSTPALVPDLLRLNELLRGADLALLLQALDYLGLMRPGPEGITRRVASVRVDEQYVVALGQDSRATSPRQER